MAKNDKPLAWRFELATSREWSGDKPGAWTGWRWQVSDKEPHAGEAMRNVTPLYPRIPQDTTHAK